MEEERGTLGLYLHFPFCVRKCAYCDFLSFASSEEGREVYINSLIDEIRAEGRIYGDRTVDTVFIGGGTPSLMTDDQFLRLFKALHESFSIREDAEISMEMNPGTIRDDLLDMLPRYVNRVSLGVQSFSDRELMELGRIHSSMEAVHAAEKVRASGIGNLNLDLMLGIPGQTAGSAEASVRQAAELGADHISAYELILEEGTPFMDRYRNGTLALPDEETEAEIAVRARELLESLGLHRYEFSNYAKEGRECRHNLRYWTGGDYLGMGLGASSMTGHVRFRNTADMTEYREYAGEPEKLRREIREPDEKREMEEFMFLGLRLIRGISNADFKRRFRRDIREVYGSVLDRHLSEGLIRRTLPDGYALTERGIDVSNVVLADYI